MVQASTRMNETMTVQHMADGIETYCSTVRGMENDTRRNQQKEEEWGRKLFASVRQYGSLETNVCRYSLSLSLSLSRIGCFANFANWLRSMDRSEFGLCQSAKISLGENHATKEFMEEENGESE